MPDLTHFGFFIQGAARTVGIIQMTEKYVIIGSGPAGITASENIRKLDDRGEITVISAEETPLFYRPRIPEYAVGRVAIEELMVKKMDFYRQARINLQLGVEVVRLDKERNFVEALDGKRYEYDKLLIATGIDPVRPPFPGGDLKGILTMHYLCQADQVNAFTREVKHVVVVGGGLLGMDMAEELKKIGLEVKLLVRRRSLGAPFFDEYGCKLLQEEFSHLGVTVLTNTEVKACEGLNGKLTKVITTDGLEIECPFCFLSIGAVPAVGWLENSGLDIDTGILVNEYLQSSKEGIFSAGNAAQILDPVSGKQITQTNWGSATIQGRIAGNNMANGTPIAYKTISHYQKKAGTLSFNLIGLGNATVEGGVRIYFKADDPKEYIMITAKEGVIVGAVVCGLSRFVAKVKGFIEDRKTVGGLKEWATRQTWPLEVFQKIIA